MSSDSNIKAVPDSQGVRRSLILAGGGARLSYQAGVMSALEEEGLSFVHFDGTSGGIFNTAMLCSGVGPKEMTMRWRKVNVSDFSSLQPFKSYFSKKSFTALGDADGIVKKIFPCLGIDVEKMNADTSIDATFNVCNFSKKRIEVFSNRNVTLQHLVAGMSLPMFMPAIKINGDWYTDAVWIKDTNINEALKRNVNEIWLIWAIGNSHEFLNGTFNQYVHMIEMSAAGGLLSELEQLESHNIENEDKKIILHVIKPEFPLPLDPDLILHKITIDELINRGYADAKNYLKGRSVAGVAPDYKASLMNEPGISLNFRSNFEGTPSWNHAPADLSLKISFNFRLIKDDLVLRAFGSLSFNDSGNTISTYNNKVTTEHEEKVLIYECDFFTDGNVFNLLCKIDLVSEVDLIMGMEFKKVHCRITGNALTQPLSFVLKQRSWERIKNAPFIYINSNNTRLGRWKEKFRILNAVYN